jgi:hypothetical protein
MDYQITIKRVSYRDGDESWDLVVYPSLMRTEQQWDEGADLIGRTIVNLIREDAESGVYNLV